MAKKNRQSSGRSRTASVGGRVNKRKKKDDKTKLYIGLGVGAFFCFIFLVAVVNSGSSNSSRPSSSSSNKASFSLPKSVKLMMYKDYNRGFDAIEDDAADAMDALPSTLSNEERRVQGKKIRGSLSSKKHNMKVGLIAKYKKKYAGLTSSYFNKILSEGSDKNW
jgi:hypothetical protein